MALLACGPATIAGVVYTTLLHLYVEVTKAATEGHNCNQGATDVSKVIRSPLMCIVCALSFVCVCVCVYMFERRPHRETLALCCHRQKQDGRKLQCQRDHEETGETRGHEGNRSA
jgi:hypothetical protein